jgi:polyribonucleotide nucleotidyltransferase
MLDSQLAAFERFKASAQSSDDRGGSSKRSHRSDDPNLPALHSIHRGRVVKIAPIGAFVQMVDVAQQGLVHVGQVRIFRAHS